MAEKDTNVKDILIAPYNLNEQYHNTKERVVWLAGVVYFTFSVFVMRWIPGNTCIWARDEWLTIATTIFLTLLFLVTSIFICGQTWHKCKATIMTDKLNDLIWKLDDINFRNYETLIRETKYQKGDANFFREGWSGVLILVAVLVFYVAQLFLLGTAIREKYLILVVSSLPVCCPEYW